MIHEETNLTTEDNGPRPAGLPGRCFYCGSRVGDFHDRECACRKRTVVVQISFDMCLSVPQSWSEKDITNFVAGRKNCIDNQLREMQESADRRGEGCLCGFLRSCSFLREATEQDEECMKPVMEG